MSAIICQQRGGGAGTVFFQYGFMATNCSPEEEISAHLRRHKCHSFHLLDNFLPSSFSDKSRRYLGKETRLTMCIEYSQRTIQLKINFFLQVHFKVSAVWYCSHYLPPVSTTTVESVANLPPVSLIPVAICDLCSWHWWCTFTILAANISAKFPKNSKWP
jgi:hypothetical protein